MKKILIIIIFLGIIFVLFYYFIVQRGIKIFEKFPDASTVIAGEDIYISFNDELYQFIEKGISIPYISEGNMLLLPTNKTEASVDIFSGECPGSKDVCKLIGRLVLDKIKWTDEGTPIKYKILLYDNGILTIALKGLSGQFEKKLNVDGIATKSIVRGTKIQGPKNISLNIQFPYPADLYRTMNVYVLPKSLSFENMNIDLLMKRYMCKGVSLFPSKGEENNTIIFIKKLPYQMETGFYDIYISYKSNSGELHSLRLQSAVEYIQP